MSAHDSSLDTPTAPLTSTMPRPTTVNEAVVDPEDQLRQVTETIPQLVWTARPSGFIDYCNARWLSYTGLSKEQIQGDGWAVVLHPEDRASTLAAWQEAAKCGVAYEVEQRLRGTDGGYRWFLTRALPFRDGRGEILKWYGTCTDIQEHKETSEALLEQQSRFAAMFTAIPDAVIMADAARRIVMVNPAFVQTFGYEEPEVLGQSTRILYASQYDFDRVGRRLTETHATPQERHIEVQYRRKDGTVLWCDTMGAAVTDRRGSLIGFLGIHRDISQLKAAETALHESELRFRMLADAAPAMLWMTDAAGSCTFLSRAWYDFTGQTEESGLGDGWVNAIHASDREKAAEAQTTARRDRTTSHIEYRVRRYDGEYRWVIDTGRPRFSSSGEFLGHVGAVFDISERILAEQHAEQRRRTLEAVIEMSPLAIVALDPDGCARLWNPAAEAMFGWNEREVIGEVPPIVPDDRRGEIHANIAATMAGGLRGVETVRRRKDGTPVDIALWSSLLRTSEGTPDLIIAIVADISQRKRAEEEVRRSEQLFRAVFEASGAGMVLANPQDGRLLRFNQKYCEITGYSEGELLQKTFLDVTHPSDRQADWTTYQQLLQGIIPEYTIEKRYIRRDGRIVWVRVSCVITRGKDGSPEYDVAVVQDITDRKEFEHSLRESETRFRTMADNIAQLAWMANKSGWIFWYNQRWFDYTGTTPRDVEGWGWQRLQHPEHVARVTKKFRDHIRKGQVWEDTFPLRGADGEYRWFLSRAIPIRDDQGDVTQWFGTNTDVTDHRAAQDALMARAAEFKALFDLSAIGMVLVDPESERITRVNAKYCEITGFTSDELLEMTLGQTTHPDDRDNDIHVFRQCLQDDRNSWNNDKRYVRKDGRIIWAHISGTILRDASGRAYQCMAGVRDITERKEAESQLARLNETLELRVKERTAEVNQLADQLRALATELTRVEQRERKRLARILHDHIQQLLVAAQMQLEWVRRDPQGERMESSVQGVASILKEAIAASRSLTVELSPPILHEAGLTGGLTWLAARMEEKNQFRVHVRSDTHAEPVDEETRFLLFESVRELLFNSLKHSGATEAHVVMTRTKDQRTKIVVEDHGAGFDAVEMRARSLDSGSFGLFSIQQRLTHIGGAMEIEGAPERGVRVTLHAPLGRSAPVRRIELPQAAPGDGAESLHVQTRGAKIRVLLVDDHKILRDGIAGLLQFERDMEVVGEASNGQEAVELAEVLRPDAVIMDVNMPVLNGIEATRILSQRLPQSKVIALSMHMERDTAAVMREAGAVAYLTKGGPFEDLLAAIRSSTGAT